MTDLKALGNNPGELHTKCGGAMPKKLKASTFMLPTLHADAKAYGPLWRLTAGKDPGRRISNGVQAATSVFFKTVKSNPHVDARHFTIDLLVVRLIQPQDPGKR